MWFPLQKSREEVNKGERQRIVYGPISAEVPDGVKDVVVQDGMDCEPLVREGFVNWDHLDGPQHLIGEPLSTQPCRLNEDGEIDENGTIPATEGRVLLYQEHQPSDAVWSLVKAMEKTPNARRRIGFSVQGEILEKQGHRIEKSRIRHLAMSHQPLMPLSFAAIAKSLRKAQEGVPVALETLNLDAGDDWVWGRCKRGGRPCYDTRTYQFHDGLEGALRHLTGCRGYSLPLAKAVLVGLAKTMRGGHKDGRHDRARG